MLAGRFDAPIVPAIILAGLLAAYLPGIVGFYAEFFVFLFAGAIVATLNNHQTSALAAVFPDYMVIILYFLATTFFTIGLLSTSQFVWIFAGCGAILLCKAIDGRGSLAGC